MAISDLVTELKLVGECSPFDGSRTVYPGRVPFTSEGTSSSPYSPLIGALVSVATNFKFKPLLDNIIVREIPMQDYRKLITGIETPSDRLPTSDRGVVMAVGDGVPMAGLMLPMPVAVGDTVQFGEYGKDRIYLHPEDQFKPELPTYWKIRVADLQGVVLA